MFSSLCVREGWQWSGLWRGLERQKNTLIHQIVQTQGAVFLRAMLSGSCWGCDSTAHDDAYWLESWQMDSGDVPLCMQSSGQPRHNPLIEETEQTFCDLNSNRVFFLFLEDRLILCSDVDSAMLDPNNRCQYFSTFNWSEHIRCMKKKKASDGFKKGDLKKRGHLPFVWIESMLRLFDHELGNEF